MRREKEGKALLQFPRKKKEIVEREFSLSISTQIYVVSLSLFYAI